MGFARVLGRSWATLCRPIVTIMPPDLKALEAEIHKALKHGMDRHWHLAKDMLRVKPEYLLTAFVADHLSGVLEFETSIRLEEPTSRIIHQIWLSSAGWGQLHRKHEKWKGRNGKVDIFIAQEGPARCAVLELKNLDPPATEVRKDVKRLCDLLAIQSAASPLVAGYLAFPTTMDWTKGLLKTVQSSTTNGVQLTHCMAHEITGEDPEDGLPAYFSNVARFTRLSPPSKAA